MLTLEGAASQAPVDDETSRQAAKRLSAMPDSESLRVMDTAITTDKRVVVVSFLQPLAQVILPKYPKLQVYASLMMSLASSGLSLRASLSIEVLFLSQRSIAF